MTPFDHIRFAGKSDIGRKRKNNEDNFGMFPALGVWLVADGMGGGDDGEVASAAVVREIDAFVSDCPPAPSGAYAADDVVRGVEAAVGRASAWIFRRTHEKQLSTCGSTVVGCVVDPVKPGRVLAFHAGDSRLYRLRGRGIKQITVDHSAAEMIGAKDESKVNPLFRGMVLRAVGVKPSVEVELTEFEVKEGDRVLICSDGLSRMVPDRTIAAISRKEGDPEKAVAALIAAANEAGGVDNVTAVLVEFGCMPEPAEAAAFPALDGPDATDSTADSSVDAATSDTGDDVGMTLSTMAPIGTDERAGEAATPCEQPPKPGMSTRLRNRWPVLAAVGLVLAVAAAVCLCFRREKPSRCDAPAPTNSATVVVPTNRPPVVAPTNCLLVVVPTNGVPVAVPTNCPPVAETCSLVVPVSPKLVTTNASVTAKPEPPRRPEGCEELAAQCEKENLATAAGLMRRRLPADRALEFGEQMKRAQSSAQAVYRLKSEKTSARFLVDLKYALQAAPDVRQLISARTELAKAWDCVLDGDVESAAVRHAAAKVLKEIAEAVR